MEFTVFVGDGGEGSVSGGEGLMFWTLEGRRDYQNWIRAKKVGGLVQILSFSW